MRFPWSLQGEAALVLSETITPVKNILKNDMFPNYIKETLDKYIAYSDVQENENDYISNQQDDTISIDSTNDIEIYDNPPNTFFMQEENLTTNVEIDYAALQKSLKHNINQHGIICNLPINTYIGYKNLFQMH